MGMGRAMCNGESAKGKVSEEKVAVIVTGRKHSDE